MAEVSHGTGDQTLEDGGLQELCAILKAGCFEDLIFLVYGRSVKIGGMFVLDIVICTFLVDRKWSTQT
jgi:hypothetical protein